MMILYAVIFYMVAALILASTGMAITRKNPVHAVVYLVISFLGSALLFYILGAPFLAALEVIIYAGAIMVLFLFVVMMLKVEAVERRGFTMTDWMPALVLGLLFVVVSALAVFQDPGSHALLQIAIAMPATFGRFIFEHYWLAVEIISILLLVGLVAAVQLGRGKGEGKFMETTPGRSGKEV
jgi:NADH-quinone oxidoreductase subunit J